MYSKRAVLFVIVSTISFFTNAQKIEKGTLLIGGNLTYLNTTQTNYSIYGGSYPGGGFGGSPTYKTSIFIGSLSLASMATKYFAIGGKISYLNTSNSTNSNVVIGPTARLYISNERPSAVFFTGNLGISTNGSNPLSYDLGIGLSNLVSEHISIDIIGTYGNSFTSNGTQSSNSRNDSDLSIFALQVGLQVLLPKKK